MLVGLWRPGDYGDFVGKLCQWDNLAWKPRDEVPVKVSKSQEALHLLMFWEDILVHTGSSFLGSIWRPYVDRCSPEIAQVKPAIFQIYIQAILVEPFQNQAAMLGVLLRILRKDEDII